jgi:hypothetical protein
VNLSFSFHIADYSPLRSVHTLILRGCRIADFSQLAGNHYHLDLSLSNVRSEDLKHFRNVFTLKLDACDLVRNLDHLRPECQVRHLVINFTKYHLDVTGFTSVQRLEYKEWTMENVRAFSYLLGGTFAYTMVKTSDYVGNALYSAFTRQKEFYYYHGCKFI